MTSFSCLIIYCAFVLLTASRLKRKDTDWQELIIQQNQRFAMGFGTHDMDKAARDSFAEEFVYISPNSTILGDFKALAKEFAVTSNSEYFQLGFPKIISTCGKSALKWDKMEITDDRNVKQGGFETGLFELAGDQAMVKLIQYNIKNQ